MVGGFFYEGCMKRSIILFLFALLFVACGDWDAGDGGYNGGYQYNERFHYYYAQECDIGRVDYDYCGDTYSLTKSLSISIRVEPDGFASVYYDGQGPLYYERHEYKVGFDRDYGEYYQFGLNSDDYLTVYTDGYEAVYSDYWNGVDYHYYYDRY